jgi:6-phosphogluconate dehydrogenase
VIVSWLLDLTAELLKSPTLQEFSGRVSDSGEGRWTAVAAVDEGVPAPSLVTALFARFSSRDCDHFANQVLSAIRKGFGGHPENPAG